jgi:hypothetical protein
LVSSPDIAAKPLSLFFSCRARNAYAKKYPGRGLKTSELNAGSCFEMNLDDLTDLICPATIMERELDCLKQETARLHSGKSQSSKSERKSVHLTMDVEAFMMLPMIFRYTLKSFYIVVVR